VYSVHLQRDREVDKGGRGAGCGVLGEADEGAGAICGGDGGAAAGRRAGDAGGRAGAGAETAGAAAERGAASQIAVGVAAWEWRGIRTAGDVKHVRTDVGGRSGGGLEGIPDGQAPPGPAAYISVSATPLLDRSRSSRECSHPQNLGDQFRCSRCSSGTFKRRELAS